VRNGPAVVAGPVAAAREAMDCALGRARKIGLGWRAAARGVTQAGLATLLRADVGVLVKADASKKK
jgi:hypothetical protein